MFASGMPCQLMKMSVAGKLDAVASRSGRGRAGRRVDRFQRRDRGVALLEVAFDFEIELLREIAGQSDARAAQPEAILQRGRAEAAFKRGDVAVFEIRLDITAEGQLVFRAAGMDIDRRRRRRGEDGLVIVARA